jgi:CRP/FNR family cyclic AMP-dependent transcriptional regulator
MLAPFVFRRPASAALAATLSGALLRPHPAGTLLFAEGDTAAELLLIERGLVKLTASLPDGSRVALSLRSAGQLLDESDALQGKPYWLSATALIASDVYTVPLSVCERILETNAAAARLLRDAQNRDLCSAARAQFDLQTLTAEQRFVKLVCRLADALGERPTQGCLRLRVPLQDRELAELLGVTPSWFSQFQSRCARRGLLRKDGHQLVIPDMRRFLQLLAP